MSASNTAVAEPTTAPVAAPKKAAKKAAPKASAKKAVKKTTKKAKAPSVDSNGQVSYGVERSHDLPWSTKKVAVFKALRSPKLQGGEGTAQQIAEIAGGEITTRDVRHYCYHAKAAGLVKVEHIDGNKYHFSLTAKGKAVDPEKALKEQEAAKAKK